MNYELKALRESASVVSLVFEAADEADAIRQAKSQGYTVLTAAPRHAWTFPGAALRERAFPLLLFSQELLVLVKAGLALTEALKSLAEKERNAQVRSVIERICAHLSEGHTLSAALQRHPAIFPPLYVAAIRASERTGDLGEALSRFVAYQSRLDLVRNKIVSASIYPVLLVAVGGLVCLFLMFYVVPRFSRIYEDLGSNLPFFSVWLLRWGQMLEKYGVLVIAGAAGAVALAVYGIRLPRTRKWLGDRLWRIPGVGERLRVYHLSRFYRMVGMLLRGGMPIVPALQMASGLLHPVLREPLAAATRHISEGHIMSQSLDQHGLATPVALRMLVVGERSGTMGEMMEQIAVFHDEEIARWVEWFTRVFEPLLMAVIGLAIGLIVILMYLPIFELAGSIQ